MSLGTRYLGGGGQDKLLHRNPEIQGPIDQKNRTENQCLNRKMSTSFLKGNRTRYRILLDKELTKGGRILEEDIE